MNKRILLLFILCLSFPIHAQLGVEKIAEKGEINVNENVQISLKFTNPFDQPINVQIKDKNIFGNNGIDIQCLERQVNKGTITLKYDPLKAFKSGNYVLDPAEVTYINPDTGKQETITSNELTIHVKGPDSTNKVTQGITTIYQCGGKNIQSISYSTSGGRHSLQVGQSQKPPTGKRNAKNEVQNNQLSQDANIIKKMMQNKIEKQQETKDAFDKELMNNKKIQAQHKKLTEQGYELDNIASNPVTNNTGNFTMNYHKQNKDTASVKGSMNNRTIENMRVQTQEDREKMLEALKQNKRYQQLNKQLQNEEFTPKEPIFNQTSMNRTKINMPYKNKNITKEIQAEYINKTIKNVKLVDKTKQENSLWWLFLIPLISIVAIFVYKKHFAKQEQEQSPTLHPPDPVDYVKESKKMIKQAVQLFKNNKKKEAYAKVSEAVRLYFSYQLDIKKDITPLELIDYLKHINNNYKDIQKCLNMCKLVEFAKYKANNKDFRKIIKLAKKQLR